MSTTSQKQIDQLKAELEGPGRPVMSISATITHPPTDQLIAAFEARGFTPGQSGGGFHEFTDANRRVSLFTETGLGFWMAYLYSEAGEYAAARITFDHPTLDLLIGSAS